MNTMNLTGSWHVKGYASDQPRGPYVTGTEYNTHLELTQDHGGHITGRGAVTNETGGFDTLQGQWCTESTTQGGLHACRTEGGGIYHGARVALQQTSPNGIYSIEVVPGPAVDGTRNVLRGQWELKPPFSQETDVRVLKDYIARNGGVLPPGPLEKPLLLAIASSLFTPMCGFFEAHRLRPLTFLGQPGWFPFDRSDPRYAWPDPVALPLQNIPQTEDLKQPKQLHPTPAAPSAAPPPASPFGPRAAPWTQMPQTPAARSFGPRAAPWTQMPQTPAARWKELQGLQQQQQQQMQRDLEAEKAARKALEIRVAQLEQAIVGFTARHPAAHAASAPHGASAPASAPPPGQGLKASSFTTHSRLYRPGCF